MRDYNVMYNNETLTVEVTTEAAVVKPIGPAHSENYNYVALEGSEKQVAWANNIRYELALDIQTEVVKINGWVDRALELKLEKPERMKYTIEDIQDILGSELSDIDELMKYVNSIVQHLMLRYTDSVMYINHNNLQTGCSTRREREKSPLTIKNIYRDMLENGICE